MIAAGYQEKQNSLMNDELLQLFRSDYQETHCIQSISF